MQNYTEDKATDHERKITEATCCVGGLGFGFVCVCFLINTLNSPI